MTLFNPYVWLIFAALLFGSYAGGRFQQYTKDAAAFQKKLDVMILKQTEDLHRVEMAREKDKEAAEAAQQAMEKQRGDEMARAALRIKSLSAAIAAMRAPAVGKLLNDTIADSTPAAGGTGKPQQGPAADTSGPDTTIGDWAKWSVDVIGLYNNCRDQVIGWIGFYAKLRAEQT